MQIAAYLLLIVYFTEIRGIPLPGLTSLRKCNKYHNLSIPETYFTPLTKQVLNNISRDEWNYPPRSEYDKNSYLYGVGGQNAAPKQLPFMAALGYDNGERKAFVCGGTLISEEFVLTAAHCIYSGSWGKVKYIRLGDLNLTSSTDDIGVQKFQLKEVYIHPDYKYPTKYHDIALIKLDAPAQFTEYVSPACLEPQRTHMIGQFFHAAGWGHLGYGESPSEHLQILFLRHYPDIKCQEAFIPEYTLPEGVKPEFQICAGNNTYISDTCEGDSGGPLAHPRNFPKPVSQICAGNNTFISGMCKGDSGGPFAYPRYVLNTVYMIAGITSFGKPCGFGKIPAVYTRVSYYTEWIEKTIWPNEFIAFDPNRIHFPED